MSQEDSVGPLPPASSKASQFPRLAPHSPSVLPSPAQSSASPSPAASEGKFTYPIDAAKPKRLAGLAWKERIFLLATLVLVPTFGVFLRRVTAIVGERVEAEEARGVQPVSVLSLLLPTEQEDALTHPRFIDFVVALAAAVLLSVARQVTSSTVFRGIAEQLVNRTQERTFRVARSANALFKLSYFVVITYWGFRVLGDQDWFPTVLGGHGHFREAWARYPETNVSVAIKRYYLLELGYHIHALFFHVFLQERKNDFLEMLLHHFIAMFLVSLSYILNYQRAGSVILILHDMADIFVYASKASVDSRHTYLTLSCYAGMLTVWGFARLYVLPFYVVYNCWFESFDVIHGGWFLVGMLTMLQCLHIYWYYLFILMGYHYAKRGETVDIQEKAHHTDGAHAAQPAADSAEKRARGKAI